LVEPCPRERFALDGAAIRVPCPAGKIAAGIVSGSEGAVCHIRSRAAPVSKELPESNIHLPVALV
ncbi:hypothetical protein, partial [Vibrio parahaemolyticus]